MEKSSNAVFINCSYGETFRPLLRAILFCLLRVGLKPLIANEESDSGRVRLNRLLKLIKSSQYSIHDLSTLEDSQDPELLHLNMPFELGLDLGIRFSSVQNKKNTLVLEDKEGDLKAMMSDFGFGETKAHLNDGKRLVRIIRNHFYNVFRTECNRAPKLPEPRDIWYDFNTFNKDLETTPEGQLRDQDDLDEMENTEFIDKATAWIKHHSP